MNPLLGSFDSAMPLLYRASWQAGVLTVVVFAVCRSCPRIPARWRCVFWSVVLVRLLLPVLPSSEASLFNVARPPIASTEQSVVEVAPESVLESEPENAVTLTPFEENTMPPTGGQSFEPVELQEFEPVPPEQTSSEVVPPDEPVEASTTDAFPIPWTALTYVWLTGVGLMFLREMLQQFRLRRQLRRCRHVSDASLLDILSSCRSEMGLRRNVRLLVTSDLVGPAVTGILRPAIILPARVAKSLGEAELRWLLCHELAHIRRRDTLTYAVWRLARAIHWFNPLAWLAASSVKTSAESASDERVLSSAATQNHIQYGQSLLRVAELLTEWKPVPTAVGIFSRRDNLKRRITMIAEYQRPSRFWTLLAATGVLVLALTGLTDAMKVREDVVNDAGASEPLTETDFDPANPPTVEEIKHAIVTNRERIRSMRVLACIRRVHDDGLLYRETYLDVDAFRWRFDQTHFSEFEDWNPETPFAPLSNLPLENKRSVNGNRLFTTPHTRIASVSTTRLEFPNPLNIGLSCDTYCDWAARPYGGPGDLDVWTIFDEFEWAQWSSDIIIRDVTVEADIWEQIPCWKVNWSLYSPMERTATSLEMVIVPEWGWSVVSLIGEEYKQISNNVLARTLSLRSDLELHEPSGIWFPSRVHIQVEDYEDQRGCSEEIAVFEVLSLNESIPEETFTFKGMGLETGSEVRDSIYSYDRQGTWNGEEVVLEMENQEEEEPKHLIAYRLENISVEDAFKVLNDWILQESQMEELVDFWISAKINIDIVQNNFLFSGTEAQHERLKTKIAELDETENQISGEFVLVNNSARACTEQLRAFVQTQDEEEWGNCNISHGIDDAYIVVRGATDEQVEIITAMVHEFDAEPNEAARQQRRYPQTYPLKYISQEEVFAAFNEWMQSDNGLDTSQVGCWLTFDPEENSCSFAGTKEQHERFAAKLAELDIAPPKDLIWLSEPEEGEFIDFYSLQNISAEEAHETLEAWKELETQQDFWSDSETIAHEESNEIIFSGTEAQHERLKTKIAELDSAPTQIQMQMTLIEVELDGEESGLLQRLVNEKKETMEPDEALAEAIEELTDSDRAKVLSRPVIRTLDGQQATIQIGEEVPITAEDGSITYDEIGWLIEATPHLIEEGRIRTWYLTQYRVREESDGSVRTISQCRFASDHRLGQNDFKPFTVDEYNGTELVMVVSAEVVVEEE
jgi:beta-lactamase regulating signal transducer with metallopeptidase domain